MPDLIKAFIQEASAAGALDIHFQNGQKWLQCRVAEIDETALLVTYREHTRVVPWAAIHYLERGV